MRLGTSGSYTARSNNIADLASINFFPETNETPGAQAKRSFLGTPGLLLFATGADSPTRGSFQINGRVFSAIADTFNEVASDGTLTPLFSLDPFGAPVSIAATNTQLLVVAGGRAYCFTLADNSVVDVTSSLVGTPIQAAATDTYFIVIFSSSNKFQISGPLDGASWPALQVNAVSVFPDNLTSVIVSHREPWFFGNRHAQPYQDTGTDEIFDAIPGALIEMGSAATFAPSLLDNAPFWVGEDERGSRMAWRASGYTPQRVSNHAVEFALSQVSAENFANLVSYSYQDGGHSFWVLYIPNTDTTWVYDVAEGEWHQRDASPATGVHEPHWSWNHVYAFGKHLVGDWKTGNLYEMKQAYDTGGGVYAFVTDNGVAIQRRRRYQTLNDEMQWIYHAEFTADFAVGLGPQPPLEDGDGNPRPPQAMLRWSNNGGFTWSNQHIRDCGFAGEYDKRVNWLRLGRARKRVYELSVSDQIPWTLTDCYLRLS